ncbi:MAG: hypothetical protein WBA66_14535 [Xanthobacteraceae bacterium]
MTDSDLATGLRRFVERWNVSGRKILSRRLEGALNRDFLCTGPEGSFVLKLTRDEATLVPYTEKAAPHAVIMMGREDWRQVLSGRWSIMSIILAGRAPFPKHQRRFLMQASMLIQTAMLLEVR